MGGRQSDPAGARVSVPAGRARTSVVAVTGNPPEGDVLATVLAELARREDLVVVCGLPMLRRATESNFLVSLLGRAMPGRGIAVVPILSCPGLQDVDVALIEQLRGEHIVVVVAVPATELVPTAEHLRTRLGADELALAEETPAGLVMQRIAGPGVPCAAQDPRPAPATD